MKVKIQNLIGKGEIKAALALLSKEMPSTEVVMLNGRFTTLQRNINMGQLGVTEAGIERNKIVSSILELDYPGETVQYKESVKYQPEQRNDMKTFNDIYRRLHQMQDDLAFSAQDILREVVGLDELFELPEMLSEAERFTGIAFGGLSISAQNKQLNAFVEVLLKYEDTLRSSLKSGLAATESQPDWEETLALMADKPNYQKWQGLVTAVNTRLKLPVFTDAQREIWSQTVALVDSLEPGFLWAFTYKANFANDINNWCQKNLKV